MRTLGIDPGTSATGWGIVEGEGNRVIHVAHGTIRTRADDPLPRRLLGIFEGLNQVIAEHHPTVAAVEDIFVSRNVQSALKLGHARGAAIIAAGLNGLPVFEYAALVVKKSVVGYGRAEKPQVQAMVRMLLAMGDAAPRDAADALAVALCHIHHAQTPGRGRAA
ncbi:MAG: crossover junction endodeoxyribonuclease RuvC [Magnetococcales bacterium]|nr:crossover junction endodeoxyribonuclease RuvC [Magnetococcales bacterium]